MEENEGMDTRRHRDRLRTVDRQRSQQQPIQSGAVLEVLMSALHQLKEIADRARIAKPLAGSPEAREALHSIRSLALTAMEAERGLDRRIPKGFDIRRAQC